MVKQPNDMGHLINDEVREIATRSPRERQAFIDQDQDYNLPYVNDLMEMLDQLKAVGAGRTRPPCRRILAPTGMAKSFILELYERRNPSRFDRVTKTTVWPVVFLKIPNEPCSDSVIRMLLRRLNVPVPSLKRFALQLHAATILSGLRPQLLLFDELQRIIQVSGDQAVRVLELIKWFSDELKIPVAVAGVESMESFFLADDQLGTRFRPYTLSPWQNDENLQRFVSTLLSYMPLREAPDERLFSFEAGAMILKNAGNTTDNIVTFFKEIARRQFLAGHEKIRLEDVQEFKL
ncbi:TniB family NTP-binding protein [Kordiimonas lipolytica]|uniref:TniB family NTP-binding protein n=1 Tax=Kordiimonas lipolytica TaxID=1662421 RepID=A0ABV8UA14_9PROT|nr:TniB family NTP-binding protein [Kordiimonas lipolytica]